MIFPTEAITLGKIRQVEPEVFADRSFARVRADGIEAFALHHFEVLLAEKAFAKAASLPDPEPTVSRGEIFSLVSDAYPRYGICAGRQAARQLARSIEAAASKQARDALGIKR